jgi:hypothetical protein
MNLDSERPQRLGSEWPKQEILDTLRKVQEDSDKLCTSDLDTKYLEFKRTFPRFYDKCLLNEPGTYNEIKMMLDVREKMSTGSVSEIEANVQISEYMAKKYVYPQMGEPTKEQKKDALRKIINSSR